VAQMVREGVQMKEILARVERMALSQALEAADGDQALAYSSLGVKKLMFGD
jgi:hypothetical protein